MGWWCWRLPGRHLHGAGLEGGLCPLPAGLRDHEAWARQWHRDIEPIARSHRDTGSGRGNGTALDINGHLHPYEATTPAGQYADGFSTARRDRVHAIADSARDASGRSIGRSGLNFARGKRDGMHLEIAPGVSGRQIAEAALWFEEAVGRSSTSPVWFTQAFGHDVLRFQQFLGDGGFAVGTLDGSAGEATDAAVKAFQRSRNLEDDGRVGRLTRAAAGLEGALIAGGGLLPDPGPSDADRLGLQGPMMQTDAHEAGD